MNYLTSQPNQVNKTNKKSEQISMGIGMGGHLSISVAELAGRGVDHIPDSNVVPQSVAGKIGVVLRGITNSMSNHDDKRSQLNTYAHVWRKTVRESDEVGEGVRRCNTASGVRILVPGALVLPLVPDPVNHLQGPRCEINNILENELQEQYEPHGARRTEGRWESTSVPQHRQGGQRCWSKDRSCHYKTRSVTNDHGDEGPKTIHSPSEDKMEVRMNAL